MDVKIINVVNTKSPKGKSFQEVTLDDGRKLGSFRDDFQPFLGKVVDVKITGKGDFNYIDLVKSDKTVKLPTSNSTPPSDLEYRKAALGGALEIFKQPNIDKTKFYATVLRMEHYLRNGQFPVDDPNKNKDTSGTVPPQT